MEEERIRKRTELQEWIQQRYPVLDITIEGDLEAGAAEVFTHFFPKWDRSKMHLHQFTDGITNKLYKVPSYSDFARFRSLCCNLPTER
jgi:hypothetical protein